MLSVKLFGMFRVTGVDNRAWSELGPAGRGLASFLFSYPSRPHLRKRLTDLFWPELDPEHARRALNSAIWRLRKLLAAVPESRGAPNLLTRGVETTLESAEWLDIDASALQQAANLVLKRSEVLESYDTLERTIADLHRYEGPFLEGHEADWVLEKREVLHSLFLQSAILVVCRLGSAELYHQAIELARHALRFDPYREELVRILITLLALNERRGEAIQYFQKWSMSLKVGLDIAPLPATQKVLDQIRALDSADTFQALRAQLANRRVSESYWT
jgi:DNA-binding SARP family transcriptional activator